MVPAATSWRTAFAAALVAAASLAFIGPVAAQQKPPSIAKRVEEVLVTPMAEVDRIHRLGNLGPDAIPVLLDLVGTETIPFSTPATSTTLVDERNGALIVTALKRFDRVQLLPPITRAIAATPSARLRLACVEVIGAVGDRRDLALLCRLASPAAPNDDLAPQIAPAFQRAAGEILLRDFGAYLVVQDVLRGQFSATRLCLYRALADTASAQAMPVLAYRLGAERSEDPILLTEIVRASRSVPLPPEIGVREALRPYLGSSQASLVQAAAASLGNLEDPDSVAELIELLVHEDSFVRERSHAALCKITGEKLLPDVDRWRAWFALELEWYRNRSQACAEDLRNEVDIRKTVAMAEVSRHALYREEFTGHMLRMLPHESEALQRLGICALGLMGSTSAVPYLESTTADGNPVLAAEARDALARILERRPKPPKKNAPALGAIVRN